MNNLHTFVICAYKESPYIEECIHSLKNQTVTSRILLATSTPSEYLEHLCKQYDIPYHVREGQSNISLDWNYALSVADTEYVTIAHQDDVYKKEYLEKVLNTFNTCTQPLIAFTDYSEIKNGLEVKDKAACQKVVAGDGDGIVPLVQKIGSDKKQRVPGSDVQQSSVLR